MNNLKNRLLHNWNAMRWVKLILGGWILVTAIQAADYAFSFFGGFFVITALTDTGCCATGACYSPPATGKSNENLQDVEFEETK